MMMVMVYCVKTEVAKASGGSPSKPITGYVLLVCVCVCVCVYVCVCVSLTERMVSRL